MLVRRDPTTTFLLTNVDNFYPNELPWIEMVYAVHRNLYENYSVMRDIQP
jgi:hypothetical protein